MFSRKSKQLINSPSTFQSSNVILPQKKIIQCHKIGRGWCTRLLGNKWWWRWYIYIYICMCSITHRHIAWISCIGSRGKIRWWWWWWYIITYLMAIATDYIGRISLPICINIVVALTFLAIVKQRLGSENIVHWGSPYRNRPSRTQRPICMPHLVPPCNPTRLHFDCIIIILWRWLLHRRHHFWHFWCHFLFINVHKYEHRYTLQTLITPPN